MLNIHVSLFVGQSLKWINHEREVRGPKTVIESETDKLIIAMQFNTLPMILIWGKDDVLLDIGIVTMERCTCKMYLNGVCVSGGQPS